ncbi:ABC transporter permease [Candidatus Uabimicrobium amorphum]|uniref:Macrolide export ATP-binding/permease protein MacB n=1 Tax=Uabimicrobium amorphum TaxID=2596890 RepID=A0A5S9IJB9_UABAM|nr:ABC transporter permease [Candidatus Uabimicrobium amorphum]BBM82110.1 macrolide export ATP-binding/permease protein MacB [Candidatus Uabimicrobium amorphum]
MYLLEMKDVHKSYVLDVQEVPVLHGINLQIASGEFVSIMGPSGSGKSTLMNLLGCLDRPSKGSYLLNGVRVESLDDSELSNIRNREVGFVFQKFNLLAANTAIQNIALPLTYRGIARKEREKLARVVAEKVGIGERLHHRPNEISGGQAQRVAIARALLGQPHLILADEPTGSLDSQTGAEILSIFHDLHRQGHTIVMVTHDEKIAAEAQRTIYLKDGYIVEDTRRKTFTATEMTKTSSRQDNLKWKDVFGIAIREGLLAHPLRTALTMLGVIFGVAAVIAMMAINEGARQKAIAQIKQMGLNNIRVRSVALTEEERLRAREHLSLGLSLQDVVSIQKLPSVQHIAPIRYVKADISKGTQKWRSNVIGTTPQYKLVAEIPLKRGRFLQQHDLQHHRRICVIGSHLHTQLFGYNSGLGKTLYIGTEVFVIVGVLQGKNASDEAIKGVRAEDVNNNIYIPLTTSIKRFFNQSRSSEIDEITMMIDHSHHLPTTSQWISKILTKRHNSVADFTVIVPQELLRQERETQRIFDIVMVCIASISLVVGGIGIMNIMLAAVTERIREIGIRRAIGANKKDVLKQFLTEAVTISLNGGILGICCGWLLAIGISSYTDWNIDVSLMSILLGVGVSTSIGVVFGIYPAWKAARLDPIVALNT